MQNFDDLCDLAKKGTPSKVDVYCSNLEVDPTDEFYGTMLQVGEVKAFSFGHGVGKKKGTYNCTILAFIYYNIFILGEPITIKSYSHLVPSHASV